MNASGFGIRLFPERKTVAKDFNDVSESSWLARVIHPLGVDYII